MKRRRGAITSAYGLIDIPTDSSGTGLESGADAYGIIDAEGWGYGDLYDEVIINHIVDDSGYVNTYTGDTYGTSGDAGWGDRGAYGWGGGTFYDGSGNGLPRMGHEEVWRQYVALAPLTPQQVLSLQNVELRRIAIEVKGPDWLFSTAAAQVVHEDVDGHGHPRQLLRLEMHGAVAGYLQAVRVVCPTTGRVYHLGVPPTVRTCQEAVASTFGLRPEEYRPVRES